MQNQTALITGSSDRIGKSISLQLAQMGYDIILHYNKSGNKANDLKKEIFDLGVNCDTIQIDFECNNIDFEKIFKELSRKINLQILVNNASVFFPSTFETDGDALFNEHLKINFNSAYLATKYYAKFFKTGSIINILDTKTEKNDTKHLDYLLSKKLLKEFTLLSAYNLAPYFRVNAISPGLILPPKEKDYEYLITLAKSIPLKKVGNLLDIQKAIEFIVNNNFITGQIIYINGGEHL